MKNLRIVLVGIIAVALVAGYYVYLSSRDGSGNEEVKQLTEVQNLILKSTEGTDYPATPREVVKLYNRILTCFYNESYTDEEFEQLAEKARSLMDADLLKANPKDVYLASLKADIKGYKDSKKTIRYTTVADSNEVEYKTVKDRECAYVTSSYLIKDGSGNDLSKTNQKYALGKDGDGKWKILAFELE